MLCMRGEGGRGKGTESCHRNRNYPPAAKKRSHWLREDGKFPESLQEWIDGATEIPGSWLDDWVKWLGARSGKQVAAPKDYAGKVIEPAPGRYVKVRL